MVASWPKWVVAVAVTLVAMGFLVANPVAQWSSVAVLGLILSAPVVLNVAALVLVWRTTGIVNLAQIQLGMLAAVAYDALARGAKPLSILHDVCAVCVATPPESTARAINALMSAAVVIGLTSVLSWAVHAGILSRAGTSVAVGLAVTGFLAMAFAGLESYTARMLITDEDLAKGAALERYVVPGSSPLTVGGATVNVWQFGLVIVSVVLVVGVWWLMRSTRWGLELDGAQQQRQWAQSLGVKTHRLAGRAWLFAGLCAGLSGVLPTMGAGLPFDARQSSGTWQLVPLVIALTALVLAGRHWLFAALVAVALTLLETSVVTVAGSRHVMGLLCAAFVIATLARLRQGGSVAPDRLAEGRPIAPPLARLDSIRNVVTLSRVGGLLLLIAIPLLAGARTTSLISEAAVLALLVLSVHVLQRFQGRSSLGQIAVAAVCGAVCVSLGWDLLASLIVAMIVGAAAQWLLLGFLTRVDELTGAVGSLIVGAAVVGAVADRSLLGALLPTTNQTPRFAGMELTSPQALYALAMSLVIVVCVAIAALRHSHLGRTLLAVANEPQVANGFGLVRWWHRLLPGALAGACAAMAGTLAVAITRGLEPTTFTATIGISAFLYAMVGGRGGLVGPTLGIATFAAVAVFFPHVEIVSAVAAGFGAVAVLWAAPGGLASLWWKWRDSTLIRYAHHRHIAVPTLMGDGGAAAASGRALLEERRLPLRPDGLPPVRRYSVERQWIGSDRSSV